MKLKEKKVGVRFETIKKKTYCYLSYSGGTTRFIYFNPDDGIIDTDEAAKFVIRAVKYLNSITSNFKLKGIGDKISLLRFPLRKIALLDYFMDKLGNILSYNQYKYLAKNSSKLECCLFHALDDFLDNSNLSNKKLKELNIKSISEILENLSKNDIKLLKSYHLVAEFEDLKEIKIIDWLQDTNRYISMIEEHFKNNNESVFEEISYHIPKSPKYTFKDVRTFVIEELDDIKDSLRTS